MITVRIFGGLGNQMFQYAYGRYLSCRKGTGIILDYYAQITRPDFDGEKIIKINDVFDLPVKLYLGKKRKDLVNRYNLHYFDQLRLKIYLKTRRLVTEKNHGRSQEMIQKSKDLYLVGYWQGEKYFNEIQDIIRKDFKFKIEGQASSLDLYKEITASNSVSLHIRGQDYLKKTFYYRCLLKYYLDAIDIIAKGNSDLKFFIFTDDLDNVRKNYGELLKFSRVVSHNSAFDPDAVDLLLMSKCRHNVICNSSFSWWGAWLNNNPGKVVVAPKKWFNDQWAGNPHYSSESRVPDAWHKI